MNRPTVGESLRAEKLIEAQDMEEALDIAARIPSAAVTGIEVRPVWELRGHAPRTGRE